MEALVPPHNSSKQCDRLEVEEQILAKKHPRHLQKKESSPSKGQPPESSLPRRPPLPSLSSKKRARWNDPKQQRVGGGGGKGRRALAAGNKKKEPAVCNRNCGPEQKENHPKVYRCPLAGSNCRLPDVSASWYYMLGMWNLIYRYETDALPTELKGLIG